MGRGGGGGGRHPRTFIAAHVSSQFQVFRNLTVFNQSFDLFEVLLEMSLSSYSPGAYPSHVFCRKHRAGVDIHSCSQFLLELYSRWILPSSSARRTPAILISEVVRSLLVVSDLFTERSQFELMYATLAELRRVHPSEDEILAQYLVPATCKAAAVLGMALRASWLDSFSPGGRFVTGALHFQSRTRVL
ncbi:hypothetical protein P7K49_005935 [Saguinus oedipus]|uniref:Uncharacterized protein n=1 Tax=Saguinus oedipus TaxID=9490 RepID=A0ABQ9W103_SAGOE|nr:hypothetical protein P7K49_005935 [Saguinus oedipus]